MRAGLALEGVAKRYGGRTVLHDISLELAPGEFLSLLGPSGCGKTTLLRIVAGFERTDGGRVRLGEADISSLPANRRNMGMVFQAYSLFPNLSAADNVRFGLRVRRLARAEQRRRVAQMLELVGLSEQADKYPHQLSGGQQQRVALARALAIQPALLLLDEPLSALDAKVRVQLREEIRRIQRETGITTLFVTHDQEEALSISDRVAVMYAGELVQVGQPAQIYREPAHPFVAEFIGVSTALDARTARDAPEALELCGRRLHCPRARGLAPGAPVRVYVRPEHVRLTPREANAPDDGLPGRVGDRIFLGSTTRLSVRLECGAQLLADVSTLEAAALDHGHEVIARLDLAQTPLLPRD